MIHQSIKKFLKKTPFYYWIRDILFFCEIKKEKKIESKYGFDGIRKYVCKWYFRNTNKHLNLDDPKTLSEKQQWIKLYDTNQLMNQCADKIAVRRYIINRFPNMRALHFLPLITIDGKSSFKNADDIDFSKLPNQFVVSCNHGSSMTVVIKDKSHLSKTKIKSIKTRLNRWLKMEIGYAGAFDFVYKNIEPRLFITKFLSDKNGELQDYKFLCFNGVVKYLWVDSDRFTNHRRTVFNLDFTKAGFKIDNYDDIIDVEKPKNFDQMIEIATALSTDFKFVRVDLYNVDGVIYFGELTFNTNGGIISANPEKYDYLLGDMLKL